VSLQQSVTSTTWNIEVEENKEFVDEWVAHVLSSKELVIKRTRKGKEVVDDIRPYICEISVGQGDLNRSALIAELKTQPRSLRPSEFLASAQPTLTMAKLRRLKQFIDTGDNSIDPLELGERLNSELELCSS
jgi:hypothetical protein